MPAKIKMAWTIYDPRARKYVCTFDGMTCTWSYKEDDALGFESKLEAQKAARACNYVLSTLFFKAHKVRSLAHA